MDRRSQILIALFLGLVVITSIWKYQVFFVERDYSIYMLVSCEPETESCFSYSCEEGDEECDDSPYKKIEMQAADASLCDPYVDDTCAEPTCAANSETCLVITCSDETLEEGEVCAVPDSDSSEEDGEGSEEVVEVKEAEESPTYE